MIKEYISAVFNMFSKVTVWTLSASAIFVTFFWGADTNISVRVLWQILGVSAICSAIPVLFFLHAEYKSKKSIFIRNIICYIIVCVIIVLGGLYFEWFYISNWKMVLAMLLLITAGYAVIYIVNYNSAKKEAEVMNEKLREREDYSK